MTVQAGRKRRKTLGKVGCLCLEAVITVFSFMKRMANSSGRPLINTNINTNSWRGLLSIPISISIPPKYPISIPLSIVLANSAVLLYTAEVLRQAAVLLILSVAVFKFRRNQENQIRVG